MRHGSFVNYFNLPVEARNCPICGSSDSETLFTEETKVYRASSIWTLPIHIAVCDQCGFLFSTPSLSEKLWSQYYSEGLTGCEDIGLPYSIDVRVCNLKKSSLDNGICVEIGSDNATLFHDAIGDLFAEILTVDVASDSKADYRSITELEPGSVSTVLHYDVLEHILDPKQFLMDISTALKQGGMMVCEVPDARKYPENALILEPEHVNHFCPDSLAACAAYAGLKFEFVHEFCSRPYGFSALFVKDGSIGPAAANEHISNSRKAVDEKTLLMRQTTQELVLLNKEISFFADQINDICLSSKNRFVCIWGINDVCLRLIRLLRYPASSNLIFIDMDGRKEQMLSEYGVRVQVPDHVKSVLGKAAMIAVCASRYKLDIASWLSENVEVSGENVVRYLGLNSAGISMF